MEYLENKVPILRKNKCDQIFDAGFLNRESNNFEHVMDIHTDKDIDDFLERFDLSVVVMSKGW